jgi:sec-independent protein translocase protein TatA
MFGLPGGSEWIVIILIIVLLFGAKKIPELMRGLGSGVKEFKKAASTTEEPVESKKIDDKTPIN